MNNNANASNHGPSLQLAIPSSNTFSGLQSDAEEGYEGSAGTFTNALEGGLTNVIGAAHGSIYPDTVPHGGNGGSGQAADPLALTNDLRRAIGRLNVDDNAATREDVGIDGRCMVSGTHSRVSKRPASAGQLGVGSSSATPASGSTGNIVNTSGSSSGQELEEESELHLKGNLEIMDRLGEGASGEVRKAKYKPTGMILAMKVSMRRESRRAIQMLKQKLYL